VDAFVPIENFGSVSVREPENVVARVTDVVTQCRANQQTSCPPGPYDGVFTLIEDHGPLVARIAKKLELPGSPVEAAMVKKSYLMLHLMHAVRFHMFYYPRAAQNTSLNSRRVCRAMG
jgi:hypothetical protein